MIGHGINYIEKVLLIAQRLGKLSANITAYWTAVRLGPMSEMGHFRPKHVLCVMSGLPPLATELRTSLVVRFVPRAGVSTCNNAHHHQKRTRHAGRKGGGLSSR